MLAKSCSISMAPARQAQSYKKIATLQIIMAINVNFAMNSRQIVWETFYNQVLYR